MAVAPGLAGVSRVLAAGVAGLPEPVAGRIPGAGVLPGAGVPGVPGFRCVRSEERPLKLGSLVAQLVQALALQPDQVFEVPRHQVIGSLLVGVREAVNVNGEFPGLPPQAAQAGLDITVASALPARGAGPGWPAWPHGALTVPSQGVSPADTVPLIHAYY